MAASNNETEDRRLGDIFNEAYNLYYDFEKSQLATNSSEFQVFSTPFHMKHAFICLMRSWKSRNVWACLRTRRVW